MACFCNRLLFETFHDKLLLLGAIAENQSQRDASFPAKLVKYYKSHIMESTYRLRKIKHVVAKLSKYRVSDKVLGRKESSLPLLLGIFKFLTKWCKRCREQPLWQKLADPFLSLNLANEDF